MIIKFIVISAPNLSDLKKNIINTLIFRIGLKYYNNTALDYFRLGHVIVYLSGFGLVEEQNTSE